MKKNLLFISILFLGFSLIICTLILANAIKGQTQLTGTFNGSLNMTDYSKSNFLSSDIIYPYAAGSMLGYDDWSKLIQKVG